jgi:hypothetical protein
LINLDVLSFDVWEMILSKYRQQISHKKFM